MKLLALLALLPCLALAADPVKTNARLPQDEIIFPQPEIKGEVKVIAKLKSDRIVSEIAQGNWVRSEHVLTYEVTGAAAGFPHKELVFVCRDTNPDPESGIMVKKVAWPFAEGSMTFHLAPDASVKHVAYFNITRYDSKNPD
jgi:hypothetical protein